MRLVYVALLFCSIAFVAYADELQALLTEDSPVAAYAFDKDSFVAISSDGSSAKGYTNRAKKHKVADWLQHPLSQQQLQPTT